MLKKKQYYRFLIPLPLYAGKDDEKFQELIESINVESIDLGDLITHLSADFIIPEFKEYDETVEAPR